MPSCPWVEVRDHKPVKVQNGVGPTKRIVSISIKCSERQYSAVLSVYVIRTNTAEEKEENSREQCGIRYLKFTLYTSYYLQKPQILTHVDSCVRAHQYMKT